MRKSSKAKQTPSRTCADCFHFCACHLWAISISTDVAPQCPVFEPVRYRTLAEMDDLRQLHKEDLAPVVHGHWIEHHDDLCSLFNGWECSECKQIVSGGRGNYCPCCGAKMDAKEAES